MPMSARMGVVGLALVSLACGPSETRASEDEGEAESSASTSEAGTSTSTSEGTDTACESVEVELTPAPIHLAFVVEGSGYMVEDFDGMTRLDAISEALFGLPDGVVWVHEATDVLGLVAYAGDPDVCPVLTTTQMDAGNGAAMELALEGLAPDGSSPAADAISAAAAGFDEDGTIILLSGHNPTSCTSESLQMAAFETRAAAEVAFEAGVGLRFIEVGDVADGYAQALANIGVGLAPIGPDSAAWWSPKQVDALREVLASILASLRSCALIAEVEFVEGGELECQLSLGDQLIPIGEPDGWTVPAAGVFELGATACEDYRADATPTLVCPCESIEA